MQRILGFILVIAGIGLLAGDLTGRLVVVGLDTTPPEWSLTSGGTIAIRPEDGAVYSELSIVQVNVQDTESGVKSVTAEIDATTYVLSLAVGDKYLGYWAKNIPTVTMGTHTVTVTAVNYADLTNTYTGTFQVYTDLQGDWYINDQAILNSATELYFDTLTLTFKFEKSTGVADNQITCNAEWTGPTANNVQLANSEPNIWTGTYTFAQGGMYTITLTADDGTQQVTMNIFDVGVDTVAGWTLPQLPFGMFGWLGLALTGFGFLLIATSPKH